MVMFCRVVEVASYSIELEGKMHPPLTLHKHPMCAEVSQMFTAFFSHSICAMFLLFFHAFSLYVVVCNTVPDQCLLI